MIPDDHISSGIGVLQRGLHSSDVPGGIMGCMARFDRGKVFIETSQAVHSHYSLSKWAMAERSTSLQEEHAYPVDVGSS